MTTMEERSVSTASQSDGNRNVKKLFKLIEDTQWDEAMHLCKQFPDQASKWMVRKDKEHGVTWRRLPLHEACLRNPPLSLIDALLDAHPLGAQGQDHNARLPIHHACVHGASKPVIHQLLMVYPDGLEVKDIWGKTPTLVAESTYRSDQGEIVELLSKKPLFYHLKKHEMKMRIEEEERRANLEKTRLREKEKLKAKIVRLEQQGEEDEKKYLSKIQGLEQDLETSHVAFVNMEKKMQEKISEINDQAGDKQLQHEKKKAELEGVVADLENEKTAYKTKIDDLTENLSEEQSLVKSLREKIEELNTKLEQAESSNVDLQTKLEEAEKECHALRSDVDKGKESTRGSQEEIKHLKQEHKAEREKHISKMSSLESQAKDFKVKFLEMEKQISAASKAAKQETETLKNRNGELEGVISDLKKELSNSQSEVSNLNDTIQEKNGHSKSMEDRQKELIDLLEKATADKSDFHNHVKGAEKECDTLRAQLESMKEAEKGFTTQISNLEKEVAKLSEISQEASMARNELLQQSSAFLRETSGDETGQPSLGNMIGSLMSELEHARKEKLSVETLLQVEKETYRRLEKILEQKCVSERALLATVEKLSSVAGSDQSEIAAAAQAELLCMIEILDGTLVSQNSLKTEISDLKQKLSRKYLKSENDENNGDEPSEEFEDDSKLRLESDLEGYKTLKPLLEGEIAKLRKETSRLVEENGNLKSEMEKVVASEAETKVLMSLASDEKGELKTQLEFLEKEVKVLTDLRESDFEALAKVNTLDVEKKLAAITEERDAASAAHHSEKADMLRKLETLIEKVLILKTEIAAEQVQRKNATADLQKSEAKNNELTKRIVALESTVQTLKTSLSQKKASEASEAQAKSKLAALEKETLALRKNAEDAIHNMDITVMSYQSASADCEKKLLEALIFHKQNDAFGDKDTTLHENAKKSRHHLEEVVKSYRASSESCGTMLADCLTQQKSILGNCV